MHVDVHQFTCANHSRHIQKGKHALVHDQTNASDDRSLIARECRHPGSPVRPGETRRGASECREAVVSPGILPGCVSRGQGRWCALPGDVGRRPFGSAPPLRSLRVPGRVAPPRRGAGANRRFSPAGPPRQAAPVRRAARGPPRCRAARLVWGNVGWVAPTTPPSLGGGAAQGRVGGLGICRGPAWPGDKARARGRGHHGRHPPPTLPGGAARQGGGNASAGGARHPADTPVAGCPDTDGAAKSRAAADCPRGGWAGGGPPPRPPAAQARESAGEASASATAATGGPRAGATAAAPAAVVPSPGRGRLGVAGGGEGCGSQDLSPPPGGGGGAPPAVEGVGGERGGGGQVNGGEGREGGGVAVALGPRAWTGARPGAWPQAGPRAMPWPDRVSTGIA